MKNIFLLLMAFNISLFAVCCCDDPQDVLNSEKQSISDIKESMSDIRSTVNNRMSFYDSTLKNSNGMLFFTSKAFVASQRLRDAVDVKENFEGIAAKTALDGANIDNAITAATLREDIGKEAEDFAALSTPKVKK